jgi:hypothetical protein
MRRSWGGSSWVRRGLAAGAGLAALAGLTACGGGDGTGAVAAAVRTLAPVPARDSAPLCLAAAQVSQVVVSEVPAFGLRHPRPAKAPITIRDAATVRALASRLCSSRAVPRGWTNCPPDGGAAYRFQFAAAGHRFRVVTASLGGCHFVSGLGPVRSAAPAFWPLINHALIRAKHP